MSETLLEAIRRAIDTAGGVKALAQACNVSVQAVYKWMENGVPANRAVQIELATAGAVKRHELRPDLYPVTSHASPVTASQEAAA